MGKQGLVAAMVMSASGPCVRAARNFVGGGAPAPKEVAAQQAMDEDNQEPIGMRATTAKSHSEKDKHNENAT